MRQAAPNIIKDRDVGKYFSKNVAQLLKRRLLERQVLKKSYTAFQWSEWSADLNDPGNHSLVFKVHFLQTGTT